MPRSWIERQNRTGIKIVAFADASIEGVRVPDAPIDRVQLRVERTGDPGGPAAMLPGIARPGVAARLTRSGNGIGPPQMLAGSWVPAINKVARAELGAGHARQDDAVGHQRGNCHRVALFDVGRVRAPQLLASLRFQCNYIRIQSGTE